MTSPVLEVELLSNHGDSVIFMEYFIPSHQRQAHTA